MSQINQITGNVPQNQTKNYPRTDYTGALGTAGMGGLAWGVGEYIFNKKPFYDKKAEVLTDTFVSSIKEGLEGMKDATFLESKNLQKTLEANIDKLSTKDDLINFFNNNKKELVGFSDDMFDVMKEQIKKQDSIDNAKASLKKLFAEEGQSKKYVHEVYKSCCDKTGKLVHDAQKISKEKFDLIKNTADKFRKNNALRAAASFAIMSAAIMCIFEFFKGRKAKKQAQQQGA